jgi:hypothetical protein
MFMFGEGAKRQISGASSLAGLALFAAQFLAWLFRNAPCIRQLLPESAGASGLASAVADVWRRSPTIFLALLVGAATFNLFYSLLGGTCWSGVAWRCGVAHAHRCCDPAAEPWARPKCDGAKRPGGGIDMVNLRRIFRITETSAT